MNQFQKKMELSRMVSEGKQVIVFDPESEYKQVANVLGVKRVSGLEEIDENDKKMVVFNG